MSDGRTKSGIAERVQRILDAEVDRLQKKATEATGCDACGTRKGLSYNDALELQVLVKVDKELRAEEADKTPEAKGKKLPGRKEVFAELRALAPKEGA